MDTLKEVRKKQRMSQELLGFYSDLSQVQISNIEMGKSKPHKSTRAKIEMALNTKINWE